MTYSKILEDNGLVNKAIKEGNGISDAVDYVLSEWNRGQDVGGVKDMGIVNMRLKPYKTFRKTIDILFENKQGLQPWINVFVHDGSICCLAGPDKYIISLNDDDNCGDLPTIEYKLSHEMNGLLVHDTSEVMYTTRFELQPKTVMDSYLVPEELRVTLMRPDHINNVMRDYSGAKEEDNDNHLLVQYDSKKADVLSAALLGNP
jgi:hypothetical protein